MTAILVSWICKTAKELGLGNINPRDGFLPFADGNIFASLAVNICENKSPIPTTSNDRLAFVRSLLEKFFNVSLSIDTSIAASAPQSIQGLATLKRLAILLLTASVQCSKHSFFVEKIMETDESTQSQLMELIEEQLTILSESKNDGFNQSKLAFPSSPVPPRRSPMVRISTTPSTGATSAIALAKLSVSKGISTSPMENESKKVLSAEIEDLRESLAIARRENAALSAKIANTTHLSMNTSVSTVTAAPLSPGMSLELRRLREESLSLRERAEAAETAAQAASARAAKLAKEADTARSLKEEIDVLRGQVAAAARAEAAAEKLRKKLEGAEELRASLKRAEAANAAAVKRCIDAEEEASKIPGLKASLMEARDAAANSAVRAEEVQAAYLAAKQEIAELRAAMSNMTSSSTTNSNFPNERMVNANGEEETIENSENIPSTNSGISEFDPAVAERLQRLERENSLLRQQIGTEGAHASAADLARALEDLETARRVKVLWERKANQANAAAAEAQATCNAAIESRDSLKALLAERDEELKKQAAVLATTKEEGAAARDESTRLAAQLREARASAGLSEGELRNIIDNLQRQLESEKAAHSATISSAATTAQRVAAEHAAAMASTKEAADTALTAAIIQVRTEERTKAATDIEAIKATAEANLREVRRIAADELASVRESAATELQAVRRAAARDLETERSAKEAMEVRHAADIRALEEQAQVAKSIAARDLAAALAAARNEAVAMSSEAEVRHGNEMANLRERSAAALETQIASVRAETAAEIRTIRSAATSEINKIKESADAAIAVADARADAAQLALQRAQEALAQAQGSFNAELACARVDAAAELARVRDEAAAYAATHPMSLEEVNSARNTGLAALQAARTEAQKALAAAKTAEENNVALEAYIQDLRTELDDAITRANEAIEAANVAEEKAAAAEANAQRLNTTVEDLRTQLDAALDTAAARRSDATSMRQELAALVDMTQKLTDARATLEGRLDEAMLISRATAAELKRREEDVRILQAQLATSSSRLSNGKPSSPGEPSGIPKPPTTRTRSGSGAQRIIKSVGAMVSTESTSTTTMNTVSSVSQTNTDPNTLSGDTILALERRLRIAEAEAASASLRAGRAMLRLGEVEDALAAANAKAAEAMAATDSLRLQLARAHCLLEATGVSSLATASEDPMTSSVTYDFPSLSPNFGTMHSTTKSTLKNEKDNTNLLFSPADASSTQGITNIPANVFDSPRKNELLEETNAKSRLSISKSPKSEPSYEATMVVPLEQEERSTSPFDCTTDSTPLENSIVGPSTSVIFSSTNDISTMNNNKSDDIFVVDSTLLGDISTDFPLRTSQLNSSPTKTSSPLSKSSFTSNNNNNNLLSPSIINEHVEFKQDDIMMKKSFLRQISPTKDTFDNDTFLNTSCNTSVGKPLSASTLFTTTQSNKSSTILNQSNATIANLTRPSIYVKSSTTRGQILGKSLKLQNGIENTMVGIDKENNVPLSEKKVIVGEQTVVPRVSIGVGPRRDSINRF